MLRFSLLCALVLHGASETGEEASSFYPDDCHQTRTALNLVDIEDLESKLEEDPALKKEFMNLKFSDCEQASEASIPHAIQKNPIDTAKLPDDSLVVRKIKPQTCRLKRKKRGTKRGTSRFQSQMRHMTAHAAVSFCQDLGVQHRGLH